MHGFPLLENKTNINAPLLSRSSPERNSRPSVQCECPVESHFLHEGISFIFYPLLGPPRLRAASGRVSARHKIRFCPPLSFFTLQFLRQMIVSAPPVSRESARPHLKGNANLQRMSQMSVCAVKACVGRPRIYLPAFFCRLVSTSS